jgi:hypothetical protein
MNTERGIACSYVLAKLSFHVLNQMSKVIMNQEPKHNARTHPSTLHTQYIVAST